GLGIRNHCRTRHTQGHSHLHLLELQRVHLHHGQWGVEWHVIEAGSLGLLVCLICIASALVRCCSAVRVCVVLLRLEHRDKGVFTMLAQSWVGTSTSWPPPALLLSTTIPGVAADLLSLLVDAAPLVGTFAVRGVLGTDKAGRLVELSCLGLAESSMT